MAQLRLLRQGCGSRKWGSVWGLAPRSKSIGTPWQLATKEPLVREAWWDPVLRFAAAGVSDARDLSGPVPAHPWQGGPGSAALSEPPNLHGEGGLLWGGVCTPRLDCPAGGVLAQVRSPLLATDYVRGPSCFCMTSTTLAGPSFSVNDFPGLLSPVSLAGFGAQ